MNPITVSATVNAPVDRVWTLWTSPEHITQWNSASDDWHTPRAENDLRPGGKFRCRMEARDGSEGFDFEGAYDEVVPNERLAYTMSDGRRVQVEFNGDGNQTTVKESFEPESMNSPELQQQGWQAILDNFKRYAESN